MKNVKLNNLSRVLLFSILKKSESNIVVMRQIKPLNDKLAFSEEENKEYGVVNLPGGGVSWRKEAPEMDVTLNQAVYDVVHKECEDISKKDKINLQFLEFMERVLKQSDLDKIVADAEERIKKAEEAEAKRKEEKAKAKPEVPAA